MVAIPGSNSRPIIEVVKAPLKPSLESARILLPNSGDPALVVNVVPTDSVQNNQATRKFTTSVEFCADVCQQTLRVSTPLRSSVTASSVLPQSELGTRHATCDNNRILQLDNNSCDQWEPCPMWDPIGGTCTLNDTVDGDSFNINKKPCMFRVAVRNSAYNLITLLHIPRHDQLFEPNPVWSIVTTGMIYFW